MLTKFMLHIAETKYELSPEDLHNWDQISCSYKRSGYDGIVRSFSSQFEFVGKAKDLLIDLYSRDRINSSADISVLTVDDRWNYTEVFRCPLDFSTLAIESHTVKINSIDNSLAALIKANKSTKYEFEVGSDIVADKSFRFDRIPMIEDVIYKFTKGISYDDRPDILVSFETQGRPWLGCVGSDVTINKSIYWKDDQEDNNDGYMIEAINDIELSFSWRMDWRRDLGFGDATIGLMRRRGAEVSAIATLGTLTHHSGYKLGEYQSPNELPAIADIPLIYRCYGTWALAGNIVFMLEPLYGSTTNLVWNNTEKTRAQYFGASTGLETISVSCHAGDKIFISATAIEGTRINFTDSLFKFEWKSRGDVVTIPAITPKTVARSLIKKMAGDSPFFVEISDHDTRINRTILLASESIRDIDGAKLYTSFSDFSDWMSVVFGYTYYIGTPSKGNTPYRCRFGGMTGIPSTVHPEYSGVVDTNCIKYCPSVYAQRFFYIENRNVYYAWEGHELYNSNNKARTDTVFLFGDNGYIFDGEALVEIDLNDVSADLDTPTVHFVHRSELFKGDGSITINDVRDVKYSIDKSVIYSSLKIGYDKKEYNNINGRDEFNFYNEYSTGCSATDKTLTMISKYRADSYGIEFATQKRSQKTTDEKSDTDVFFVLIQDNAFGTCVPDRTAIIYNSISDSLFNGAFSPMSCIMANVGYIQLQADSMLLSFASSAANSGIDIDDVSMSADIALDEPIATNGVVEFTTDMVGRVYGIDEMIVILNDGITYKGYLKEVDVRYPRTESAKYKLIVKEIIL